LPDFASRLLDFPVRGAAVQSFLFDLRAKRLGDIAALQAILGDHTLWTELFEYWQSRGWIVPAPHSPMYVFAGPDLPEEISLEEFCGKELDEA
jgi:hypothetical protein